MSEVTEIKYPKVKVKLLGEDGNAFAILGRCKRAVKEFLTQAEIEEFMKEATSGDYNHLLQTCMKWFTVS